MDQNIVFYGLGLPKVFPEIDLEFVAGFQISNRSPVGTKDEISFNERNPQFYRENLSVIKDNLCIILKPKLYYFE